MTNKLPKATFAKLVKDNGVERIGGEGLAELLTAVEEYTVKLGQEAQKLADHAGRKTIKAEDVKMAKEAL